MQHAPYIPENSPFNPSQRIWLNGYLAGLFAGGGPAVASAAEPPARATVPLLVLFGSQTGTAEKLAKRIAKESRPCGCEARVVDAAAHATVDWSKETNLLIVTSTYGDGEMPDNAQEFWNWLQTDAASALARMNFSVLALGDTNYSEFCAAGRKIDERLEQLGARRIHPRVDCDVDYEALATAWINGALAALAPSDDSSSKARITEVVKIEARPEAHSKANPFPARLLTNRRLNGDGSEKETRHFEISLEGSGLAYEAGDALGVIPANCPALVEDLLVALGCDGEEAVPVPGGGELPLRKALTAAYDIARPTNELMQRVASQNSALRELLASERKDELKKWLWGREVIDLLLGTPDARFTPAEFVALLKKMAPRLYSISSSPKAHAGQVHLTINVVRHQSHGRSRKGVCSTFLADRAGVETPVPVFIQTSHGFRLPSNGDTPVIMIGPGTGVAPFRAFLHERRATGAKGRNWLVFGEQRSTLDFYYRDELEPMLADRHLTRLDTAFSRDQSEKVYVQHRLVEHAAELWTWLQDGAHVYVCGDASRMAKDVDAALHSAVATAGGLGAEGAVEFVKKLKADKRYQRDVY
ncbi:MAG: sulfite reductase subunit alpha [Opitutaceae bacterium]|nr:sulfite reductase subunit alpha [Verrucomicrobiales bacterium]